MQEYPFGGIVVFADEIYDTMLFDGNPMTHMAALVKNTLCCSFGGLSKVCRHANTWLPPLPMTHAPPQRLFFIDLSSSTWTLRDCGFDEVHVMVLVLGLFLQVYRACGFRVGWMVCSGDRTHAHGYLNALNMLSGLRLCANVPGQYGVKPALEGCAYQMTHFPFPVTTHL